VSTDLGSLYRATIAAIMDSAGNLVNPSTVTFTVTLPDQTTSAVTPVNDSTGYYHADYLTFQEGLHRGQWATTSPVITLTDYFNVTSYRSLVGLDEVKAHLAINDTRRDNALRSLMAAATGLVEEKCGTCVIRTITGDWITAGDRPVIRLAHAPLPSTASVTSIASVYNGGPSWLTADLLVNKDTGTCWTANQQGFYYGPWRATYTAGRTIIPEGIISGCKEIIWDIWATQRGITGDEEDPSFSEVGAFESTLAIPQNYRLPIRALEFLDPHTMPGFA